MLIVHAIVLWHTLMCFMQQTLNLDSFPLQISLCPTCTRAHTQFSKKIVPKQHSKSWLRHSCSVRNRTDAKLSIRCNLVSALHGDQSVCLTAAGYVIALSWLNTGIMPKSFILGPSILCLTNGTHPTFSKCSCLYLFYLTWCRSCWNVNFPIVSPNYFSPGEWVVFIVESRRDSPSLTWSCMFSLCLFGFPLVLLSVCS